MTPIRGLWPLRCRGCQAVAYLGDSPLGNPLAALADLGDNRCPRNKVGCPSTTAALSRIGGLRTQVATAMTEISALQTVSAQLGPIASGAEAAHAAMNARITALEARTPVVRITTAIIASLLAGASTTITVTWPNPMPTTVYDVAVNNPLSVTTVTARTTTTATVTVRTGTVLTAATVIFVAVGWST